MDVVVACIVPDVLICLVHGEGVICLFEVVLCVSFVVPPATDVATDENSLS